MKYIIGLNAIGFNTSATLIKNGKILAAVEEERLSREKRTRKFPSLSIKYLLKRHNFKIYDISAICISWNTLITLKSLAHLTQMICHLYRYFTFYSWSSTENF